jgi:plastocyanin
MKLTRFAALGAVATILAASAAACGGDGAEEDDATSVPAATATSADAPAATATTEAPAATATGEDPAATATTQAPAATATQPAAGPEARAVTAADLSFTPSTFTINGAVDTTITLTNSGALPHTIHVYRDQAYPDAVADTGNVSGGGTGEVTIASADIGDAAQLFFRCNIHPVAMQGTITVE